jgi:hypothetical protein
MGDAMLERGFDAAKVWLRSPPIRISTLEEDQGGRRKREK